MRQERDKATGVLIVGAGPTGLMMACQLALRSIPFRIIDKKEFRTNYSGALIIQARTLEIFHQMGIAQTAIRHGIIANEIKIRFNGKRSFRIPVKNIGQGLTKFPYWFLLEQSKTEKLLTDFLISFGHTVEYKTELQHFTQDFEGITAMLKNPDGNEETLKTGYLIAADGSTSAVREQLAIPFRGSTHPVSLFITDCKAEANIPPDTICFSFSNAATFGLFPLTHRRWRIDGLIPGGTEEKSLFSFHDIEKKLFEKTRMEVKLHQPEWFSVFHSHQRCALSFKKDRCFLAGDAAHVHSPVGAQGMNTGLQDAYNLAWKIAMVIQKKAKETLLDTYTSEREGIARNTIRSSNTIFKLVTSQNFFIKIFRLYAIPFILELLRPTLNKQKIILHFLFRKISEIGIQYRKSPLSQQATLGNFPSQAPKPGDRLPFINFREDGKEMNIHEKSNGTGFHLFIFAKHGVPDAVMRVGDKYTHLLSTEIIPFTPETRNLYERLGIQKSGYYLIRPDQYIAYLSCKPEAAHLEHYLQQFLIST